MNGKNVQILYEDEDVIVINKPFGAVVNRAETFSQPTVQDWMVEHLSQQAQLAESEWKKLVPPDFTPMYGSPVEIFTERQGLVHRLDKDTSGALILAKNPGALVNLLRQFREREVTKMYQCLTHGKFATPRGTLNFPVGRRSRDRKLFGVVADGRPAVTEYRVSQYFTGLKAEQIAQLAPEQAKVLKKKMATYQGFSLVEAWPKTGRTHQIRVHMHHIGHPIVGDSQYGGKKRVKLDGMWCPRQFLHAAELTIAHPRTGEATTFKAPLPPDLQKVLDYVE